jgi:hypothetical protein
MLIRELEFYDRNMLHLEQPVKLRVRRFFSVPSSLLTPTE